MHKELHDKLRANLRDLEQRGEIRAVKVSVDSRVTTTVRADCRCGNEVILWRQYTVPRFKIVYDPGYGSQQVADGYSTQIDDILPALRTGVVVQWPNNRCGLCKARLDAPDEMEIGQSITGSLLRRSR